jgi:hypothetical protein
LFFEKTIRLARVVQEVSTMNLKTILDQYEQGKADLLDIGLILTEECGLGDPEQIARAMKVIDAACAK